MKIKFLEDASFDVVDHYDEEEDECIMEEEHFFKGEECEVDLLREDEETVSFQLGDGSCVYDVPKNILEITERDED